MFEMKTWEEATKFKKSEIARIIFYILNAILDIATGIIGRNIAWIVCGILWIVIAIIEGCYLKIQKGNEEIIDLQEKHTELQAIIIDALLNETAVEVDISKIKIPRTFFFFLKIKFLLILLHFVIKKKKKKKKKEEEFLFLSAVFLV